MIHLSTPQPQAILAFNQLAKRYDDLFTKSLIGRAQRNAVWDVLERTFRPGDRILELNCGTGEDALFLASKGVSVVACDASEEMIDCARQRHSIEAPNASVMFGSVPIEQIADLRTEHTFDGVFLKLLRSKLRRRSQPDSKRFSNTHSAWCYPSYLSFHPLLHLGNYLVSTSRSAAQSVSEMLWPYRCQSKQIRC